MANQIKYGAIISYAAIFLNIILGLLYTPWMVHQIGVSDYGLFSLAGAFLTYFVMDFGLGSAIARFLTISSAKKDVDSVNNIISTSFRIYLIIDIIIFIALAISYLFINQIFTNLPQEEIHKFKFVFCIISIFSLLTFPTTPINGLLIAKEQFVFLKSCDLLTKVVTVVLMIIFLSLGYGLYTLVIVNGLIGFIIAICKLYYSKTKLNVKFQLYKFDITLIKSLFKFSFWVFIIGIAQRLLVNICPTILGMRSSTTEISIFAIATTMEGFIWHFAQALNGLFIPKVTKLSLKESNRTEITNLMIKIGRIQLFIIGFIIIGMIIFGKIFMKLWMGVIFENSYYVLILIISPGLITLTQEIAYTLLFVENEIKYRAIIFILASLISLLISYTLSNRLGAIGCGIGIFFSLISCHIIGMNLVYALKLNLNIIKFFKLCHMKFIIPMFCIGIIFYILQLYCNIQKWGHLFIIGSGYFITYIIVMWFFVLNKYEKDLFLSIITKIKLKFNI